MRVATNRTNLNTAQEWVSAGPVAIKLCAPGPVAVSLVVLIQRYTNAEGAPLSHRMCAA